LLLSRRLILLDNLVGNEFSGEVMRTIFCYTTINARKIIRSREIDSPWNLFSFIQKAPKIVYWDSNQ